MFKKFQSNLSLAAIRGIDISMGNDYFGRLNLKPMAQFLTRVELHKSVETDYDTLHSAMTKQGFAKTITGESGTIYKLPTAEYLFDGDTTKEAVFEKANSAAKSTGKSYWIITVHSNGSMFLLESVKN